MLQLRCLVGSLLIFYLLTGGLQSSSRPISKRIKENGMHPTTIWRATSREYVMSIKVSQTPLHITVKVGDSVEMMCSWETSQTLPRIQVEWKKNNISHVISKKTYLNTTVIEVVNRTTLKILNTSATLLISNTERSDVGKYYCILIYEIPILTRESGNGTQLDITEDVAKSNTESSYITTPTAVLLLLLLVLIIVTLVYRRRRKPTSTRPEHDQALDIELEEIESPYEEVRDNSLSSRGSTQWATSMVYESFDYFAVKDKEDAADMHKES
ncbi:uncharacterized protein LOC120527712 isoform X2 [Polypterus senegalus]|uniref:uncharacterized protein LOC120527712 isoform X2 n=1 Tax=Polypterus senegalus TaxID=55291 RepID=UPI001964B48C|nr:uncharacterized protein LOC120527712 isoform X2 [Polypterus senegalus]